MFFSVLLIAGLIAYLNFENIILSLYGVHDPKIENEQSIIETAKEYGLDTKNILSSNGDDFYDVISDAGIPDCDIYDSKGNYIEYRATDTSCNANLFQFIPNLAKSKNYNKTGKSSLSEKLNKLRTLKGKSVPQLEEADFYILMYWTTWTGHLNKDHVKAWEDLAMANKTSKIKVLKVNLDIQEYWDDKLKEEAFANMGKIVSDIPK
jgi:hypothetical protein